MPSTVTPKAKTKFAIFVVVWSFPRSFPCLYYEDIFTSYNICIIQSNNEYKKNRIIKKYTYGHLSKSFQSSYSFTFIINFTSRPIYVLFI